MLQIPEKNEHHCLWLPCSVDPVAKPACKSRLGYTCPRQTINFQENKQQMHGSSPGVASCPLSKWHQAESATWSLRSRSTWLWRDRGNSPSTTGLGCELFRRREGRKRVRSLKLQLFCTLVGLPSAVMSVLGDRLSPSDACLLLTLWPRGLAMRTRSLKLSFWLRATGAALVHFRQRRPPTCINALMWLYTRLTDRSQIALHEMFLASRGTVIHFPLLKIWAVFNLSALISSPSHPMVLHTLPGFSKDLRYSTAVCAPWHWKDPRTCLVFALETNFSFNRNFWNLKKKAIFLKNLGSYLCNF